MSWLKRLFHRHDWIMTAWSDQCAERYCWKCQRKERRWRDGAWELDAHDPGYYGIRKRALELHPSACIEMPS